MFNALRQRAGDEGGFTLIELLVVILIIGILAAIAIPAFLSQTSKANDAAAKTQVGTLQTTVETYASEHNGSYVPGTGEPTLKEEVEKIEPTLKDTTTAVVKLVEGKTTGYKVESEAAGTKDTYALEDKEGEITRTCSVTNKESPGGCKLEGTGTTGKW